MRTRWLLPLLGILPLLGVFRFRGQPSSRRPIRCARTWYWAAT